MDETLARRLEGVGTGRSRSPAPAHIPVALRSVTRQRVSRGRFPPIVGKKILLVKWVIDEGEAAIGVEGRRLKFRRGDVAVHMPSGPHQFWVLSDECEMTWFSLDGPVVEEFALAMGLRAGVYSYGDPPVDRIASMIELMRDYTMAGHRRASLAAIGMLYELVDRIAMTHVPSVVSQAQRLIHTEFADPDLSVDTIAERLHYHRGSLSRVFHKYTGTTIMNYITQVRLQHARTMLLHTEDRIGDIALRCGFREANYFCRWVSKHTGIPPSKLRRESVM
ncbi:MAG TPA: helix-turn-helix transcriptional regulator [Tepidisphaeraceae bacterium]